MALASDALARRTSIRVVLMDELKQASRRPSSPMFNNRLTAQICGPKWPRDRGREDKKCEECSQAAAHVATRTRSPEILQGRGIQTARGREFGRWPSGTAHAGI